MSEGFHQFKNPTGLLSFFMPCPLVYLGDPIRWNGGIHGVL